MPLLRLPSHAVASIASATVVSTPGSVAATFGSSAPPPTSHVPSSQGLTATTVCSTTELSGLLHPETEQGSLCFASPALPPPTASEDAIVRASARPFPQRCSHPSKKTPRQQPCCVAATVAFLSLCLRPVHHTQGVISRRRPSTSRLCSTVGSVARLIVADDHAPSPSWAWFPSRVLTETDVASA